MKFLRVLLLILCVFLFLSGCDSKHQVTFDLNYEGATGAPAAQAIEDGKLATEPNTPTRTGYEFLGWFKSLKDTVPFSFRTPITSDLKLYAKWQEITEEEDVYYLAGSFNSYIANDPDYAMVKGVDGKYRMEVTLNAENRDNNYDGHYYKVTNGTWDADGCWGVDNYYITPAPSSPTGGGLGSIWHWANGTLKVTFDPSDKKITDELIIAEAIIEEFEAPRIYGAFNSWNLFNEGFHELTDPDGDGIYTATIDFSAEGSSDFIVVTSKKWYDDQWGQRWGAEVQYRLDGSSAGMGNNPTTEYDAGSYLFKYDSTTNATTMVKVEADVVDTYFFPRIYGEFNAWNIDGENALFMSDPDGDGIYTAELVFTETGSSDFIIALSRKFYDDQLGKRWGAEEQYRMDGTVPGMGNNPKSDYVAGTYLFKYNSVTHVTTMLKIEKDAVDTYVSPRIYGKFNTWVIDGENAVVLSDPDGDGIYTAEVVFAEAGNSDFIVVLSRKFYDDQWGQRWGAEVQYRLDGNPAGMGTNPEASFEVGTYLFKYNSITHVTTMVKVVKDAVDTYVFPRIYGQFNSWLIDGANAVVLSSTAEDNIYTVEVEFTEAGSSDFTVVLSRKFYDDQWGQRWGAEEQYKFDGTAAGMGAATTIEYEVGVYVFTFNKTTKITTYAKK